MELLKQLIDFGVFEKQEIFHKGGEVKVLDIVGDLLHQLRRGTKTQLWGYALNVEIIGKREDKNVKYVLKTSHPEFKKWGGERAYAILFLLDGKELEVNLDALGEFESLENVLEDNEIPDLT